MFFSVSGIDNSGKDRTIQVRALDNHHAVNVAREQGVFGKVAVPIEAVEHQRREEEARHRQAAIAAADDFAADINDVMASIAARLAAGRPVFLYKTVYLPVDSVVLDERLNKRFDIPELRVLGLTGWEVMQVVPRTLGVGIENYSVQGSLGKKWSGGVGGNVVGAHVILKKALTSADLADEAGRAELSAYISANRADFQQSTKRNGTTTGSR